MRPLLPVPRRAREVASRPPTRRAAEATPQQIVATGASLGSNAGLDPIDGDRGFRPAGSSGRQVPEWTRERAREFSVAGYRSNPMVKAIIDTYTSFCVGDKGVSYQVTNPQVQAVVDEFWTDPANNLAGLQDPWLRDQLLMGETLTEMITGAVTGATRFCPVDPSIIEEVVLDRGNPLWPQYVRFTSGAERDELTLVGVNDYTGLRTGDAMLWTPFKALITDTRGLPFLSTVLDWLDSYDQVLGNLIDRTALARYLVWDVTIDGGQTEVDAFVKARGGTHTPRSGSVEVHNKSVEWKPQMAQTGAFEDTEAASSVLTLAAAGSGLSKPWLAEPDGANRATSMTMAEPVRRRISGVQGGWLGYQRDLLCYVVDRAVAARRIPAMVDAKDPSSGQSLQVKASQTVSVHGPEIAAEDAQISATVLMNLSIALEKLTAGGVLSKKAAQQAAKKAWEDFVGVPYRAELDSPDGDVNDVATYVDDKTADGKKGGKLLALP